MCSYTCMNFDINESLFFLNRKNEHYLKHRDIRHTLTLNMEDKFPVKSVKLKKIWGML